MTSSSCATLQPYILFHYIAIPFLIRFFQKLVKKSSDTLVIIFPSTGQEFILGASNHSYTNDTLNVRLVIENPISLLYRLLIDRKIGIGESYMAGDWQAKPSPRDLLRLLIRARKSNSNCRQNKDIYWLVKLCTQISSIFLKFVQNLVRFIGYLEHKRRKNTLTGSRANIRQHYDLGNDLFALFLDDTMTYSCAIFENIELNSTELTSEHLYMAQIRKYDTILDMMQIKPGEKARLFPLRYAAIHAVRKYNCQWTGLTISKQQYEFACNRIKEEGLDDKIEIKFLDYRRETGVYDKVLSIEMIEAVGHEFLPDYFQTIRDRLTPGGCAAIQAILCPNEQYERYRKSTDFIKKHIFPGGHMPSLKAISDALPNKFEITQTKDIGRHYAITLDIWCREFYFAMCSALFEHENISTVQMSFTRIFDALTDAKIT